MKWMRERDLLIAQTMAFVQSVTGKTPEAEKTITPPVALPPVETSETATAPMPDIEALWAMSGAVAPAQNEISRPAPMPHPSLPDDFQSEIKARVANFRAHQERFNREREAYCSATMAKVHAALREGTPPQRPSK
jgi:hypothetical protein